MASQQSRIRKFLAAISSLLICLLIYINIHAMKRDASRGKSASTPDGSFAGSGLLRMLEQSIQSSSSVDGLSGKGGDNGIENDLIGVEFSSSENSRVKGIEKKIEQMENAINQMDREFRSLGYSNSMKDYEEYKLRKSSTSVRTPNKEERTNKEERKDQAKPQTPPTLKNENLTGMNILLLYADDWTHSTLSSFHKTEPLNTILKTPILDALASEGIRFTHNCVTTSVCWVSRATLFTGQYMSRHKTREPCCWNGMKKPKEKLEEPPSNWKELSIYELLADNGYHVGHAGKWGVYMPFDKNIPFNVEEDGWHYRKLGKKVWHITEKNEADALRFLGSRPQDKPFFLNVAFYATHAKDGDVRQYMPQSSSMHLYADDTIPMPPTGTEEAWKKMPSFFDEMNEGRTRWHWRYDNHTKHQTMMKNYYRMATEVDTAIGAILEELVSQNALDNTMIIFTTDNGNFHGEHQLADKWFPHQESIRVPLIIRDPRMKKEQQGTTNGELTLNIDLAPTILAAAGVSIPEKMMGRDMSKLYTSEETKWRTEFFYEHPVISNARYIPSSEALVRKDYKYMYWPDYKVNDFCFIRLLGFACYAVNEK